VGERFAIVTTTANIATNPRQEYSAMKNPFFRKILPSGQETFFIRSPPK
jgi:hypothetical protein